MLETEAGWYAGKEVVTVKYDPATTSFEDLVGIAKRHGCTDHVWVRTDEQLAVARRVAGDVVEKTQDRAKASKTSDLLYYLRKSPLRFLPMTALQRVRVNADLGSKRDPLARLSPRQRTLAARLVVADERAKLGKLEELPPLADLWRFE